MTLFIIGIIFLIALLIALYERRMRGIRGYSKVSGDLVFKQDIEESMAMLQCLFGIPHDDPLVDTWPIETAEQQAYFSDKYNIEFMPDVNYFLHSY